MFLEHDIDFMLFEVVNLEPAGAHGIRPAIGKLEQVIELRFFDIIREGVFNRNFS